MLRCSATISFADEAGAPSRYCLDGRVGRRGCNLAVVSVRLCRLDFRALTGPSVTLQLTILKILNAHPEGRASLVDLKRYVEILVTSGPDWTAQMKRLATRAPQLDIFGQSLVWRDKEGWQITDKGRAFLASIEAPFPAAATEPALSDEVEHSPALPPPVHTVGPKRRSHRRRRRRAADPTRRSA